MDVAPPARIHEPAKASVRADTGTSPVSVGGAPGGAGPYVTGAAHSGWRARWHARAARAGSFAKSLPREPRKLPWGLANPWRLPALHHPRFGGERKKGKRRARAAKNRAGQALAAGIDAREGLARPPAFG